MKRFLAVLATCTIFALPLTCGLHGRLPNPVIDLDYSPGNDDGDESLDDVVLEYLRDLVDEYAGG